jgi:hypothetical protein
MPNTELLIKEAEGLPPEYFTVVLNLIRSLKQASTDFHTTVPVPGSHKRAIEECWGLAKRMGFTFSSDQLLENRRKDKELEEAQFRRMFGKDREK